MIKKLILMTTILATSCAFAARINVTPLIINFTPTGAKYKDITVANIGKSTAYVKVTVAKISNPGMPNQKRLVLKGDPMRFGLVASPIRLVIPPKQLRRVRVLPLIHNNKTDAMYKIHIAPAAGQMESLMTGKKVSAGLQIIVGYSIKTFIRPIDAKATLSIVRDGKSMTIKNSGNSNVLLSHGRQCVKNKCTPIINSVRRVYAGNTWTFKLEKAAPVTFDEKFVNQTQLLKSN